MIAQFLGAAIATTISQFVSCILALIFLIKSKEIYRVELHKIRMEKKMVAWIIALGLPTGLQNMLTSFSNVIVQSGEYSACYVCGTQCRRTVEYIWKKFPSG